MALYVTPTDRVGTRKSVDECGMDMCVTSGPPFDAPFTDLVLYYWAVQVNFYAPDGTSAAGGHFGLQAFDFAESASLNLPRSVVNWGVYDDSPGHGTYAALRGSISTDPRFRELSGLASAGSQVSMQFNWRYGDWYRFRVFKSPRQDWTANELDEGYLQYPPYIGTNQQANEVAYRCTIQNVTRGEVPIIFRDVLIKNCRTVRPIYGMTTWTEPIGTPDLTSWPYHPEYRLRNVNWDGPRAIKHWTTTYTDSVQNAGIEFHEDHIAQVGYGPTMTGWDLSPRRGRVFTRAAVHPTQHGESRRVQAQFWDSSPPNQILPSPILPLISPSPTPRPWY